MHRLELRKPDGRALILYGRQPIAVPAHAPSPFPDPLEGRPHLRWHPLRGEWVTYAAYRQGRTFLPPPQYNPLAPTRDPASPTEVPAGEWDIAVFDNRFPALMPPDGKCEVVVFTQDADASLGALPLGHMELLFEVWEERTRALAALGLRYVLPFENRGSEVGVTLHHPHGQIYGYAMVPPVPARMQQAAREASGTLRHVIAKEISERLRLIYHGPHAVAFVPFCARYPYEVWVAPTAPAQSFSDLAPEQRADLARALKTVLMKYDALWNRPFPYLMAWYQAPTDGETHPEWQLHAEFYPPYRTRDRLKYLAGTEIAAGVFAMDAVPEEKARELQQVAVRIDA